MTFLSRKADYALLILWYLYHKPGGGCARAIADRFAISRAFVANILKELCNKGFVTSHRGVKGGYALRPAVPAASLADLLEALDESFRFAECNPAGAGAGCPLEQRCPLHGPIAEVHNRLRGVLRRTTLADLFRPPLTPGAVQVGLASLGVDEPCAAPLGE